MDPKVTNEYRAQLTLNHTNPEKVVLCSFTSPDRNTIQDLTRSLFTNQPNLSINMKGKPLQFQERPSGAVFIYHESYAGGTQPIGEIWEHEVPETASAQNTSQQRLQAARAA